MATEATAGVNRCPFGLNLPLLNAVPSLGPCRFSSHEFRKLRTFVVFGETASEATICFRVFLLFGCLFVCVGTRNMYVLVAALGENKFSEWRTQYGNKARQKREMGAGVGAWVAGRAVLCDRQAGIPGLEHISKIEVHKVSRFIHYFIANSRNMLFVLLARIFDVSRFGLSVIGFRFVCCHFAYHVLEVKITHG